MTVEQAKEKYGNRIEEHGHQVGYVYCETCPLHESDQCPDYCNGYSDAWEAISKYLSEPKAEASTVDHPSHYNQGGIECIDAMISAYGKEAVENFCLLNAFKYVWRNRDKNGFEDIDKAIWYLNKLKELIEND